MELRTKDKMTKQVISKREVDFTKETTSKIKLTNELESKSIKTNEEITKTENTTTEILQNNNTNKTKEIVSKSKTNKNKSLEDEEIYNKSDKEINIHKNHRQRLKTQFLDNGLTALTDIQKLELLLFFSIPQKDTNPIAHKLLSRFGSIKEILSAEPSRLMEVNGIKENSVTLIKLVNSMLSYISMPNMQDSISSVIDAKEFCSKLYSGVDVEQFYVICLTKSNKIKNIKLIKSGSSDEVNVQIRTITEFALESKCNRIIISHNHPNGYADMSDEDCSFTYSLICSCLLNSIDIIDHIIVGTDRSVSLASMRVLQKLKERAVNTIQLPKDKVMQLSNQSKEYIIDEE